MPTILETEKFLDKFDSENLLLLDVRSEKEYDHAHIPGAINIPLLNNEHRHLVGIEYKTKGREAAVALGLKLVGPHFHEFIVKVNELTDKKKVMLYCWRGGMRSSIMGWILSMSGYKVKLLQGGYKSFRSYILLQFEVKKEIRIVGGHTGIGKTDILKALTKNGEQVIDMEGLASHRGSAFGALGMKPQPSTEFFENQLGLLWRKTDPEKIVWLEAESHTIGQIKIPDAVFVQLQSAPLFEIYGSRELRKKRILEEYGVFPKKELAECTSKLRKRLGLLNLMDALNALEVDKFSEWLEILLDYYDKTYSYSLKERNSLQRIPINVNDDEIIDSIASRLIEESSKPLENLLHDVS